MQPIIPNDTQTSVARQTKHRVSLACLACRSHHVRCDAAKPSCGRCSSEGTACLYTRSRRNGNRRRRVEDSIPTTHVQQQDATYTPDFSSSHIANNTSLAEVPRSRGIYEMSITPNATNGSEHRLQRTGVMANQIAIEDALVGNYYRYFHAAHPCALPRWALDQHCAMDPVRFKPITLVMRYIGSLFETSIDSEPYREIARSSLPVSLNRGISITPHGVQAMLLYSIAVFWCDAIAEGIDVLGKAIKDALDLGMHLENFASRHGHGNSLLEESWRRTWWQIYLTEGNIAGSTRKSLEVSSLWACHDKHSSQHV